MMRNWEITKTLVVVIPITAGGNNGVSVGTHNQGADRHVPPVEHPKGPRGQPPVPFLRGDGQDLFLEQSAEHGAVVAFVDARHGNGELQIFELVEADVDRVVEVVGEEEEGGGVFCEFHQPDTQRN